MEENSSDYSVSGLTTGSGGCESDDTELDGFCFEKRPFQFSFISYSEFNAIFKKVKRERQKKKEAQNWEKFLQMQAAKELEEASRNELKKSSGKRDGSTITNDNEAVQPEQFYYESKIPQLARAPVTTHNEIGNGDAQVDQEPIKENIEANISKNDIIKFVHASSDGNEDITNMTYEKEKKGFKGRQTDRKLVLRNIESFRLKIVMSLNALEHVVSKDPTDMVEVDMNKCKKRNVAFAARFKRNYHYHLVCQLNDVQKLIKSDVAKKKPNVILEKILSSHQVVFQALQVVEKHLAGSCPVDETYSWLKEFIVSVYQLTSLLSILEENSDQYDEVKVACEDLNDTIENFNVKMAEAKMYEKFIQKMPNKKSKQNGNVNENLWMYRNKNMCCRKTRMNKNFNKAFDKS